MGTSLQDCDSTPGGVVAHFQFGSIRAGKFNLAIFSFYCNFYLFDSFLLVPYWLSWDIAVDVGLLKAKTSIVIFSF